MGKKQKLGKMGDKSSTFIACSFSPCFSGNMAYLKGKLRNFYFQISFTRFFDEKTQWIFLGGHGLHHKGLVIPPRFWSTSHHFCHPVPKKPGYKWGFYNLPRVGFHLTPDKTHLFSTMFFVGLIDTVDGGNPKQPPGMVLKPL